MFIRFFDIFNTTQNKWLPVKLENTIELYYLMKYYMIFDFKYIFCNMFIENEQLLIILTNDRNLTDFDL